MIPIKTDVQVAKMRQACAIAARVLRQVCNAVQPGVTTYDLDQLAYRCMQELGARSACYQYAVGQLKFPAYTCLSINEELVHGIGSKTRQVRAGDIVTVDVSVVYEGFVGDNAYTVMVPPVQPEVVALVECTQQALAVGIDAARATKRVGHISGAIQAFVSARGFSVVRDFVGHGVGEKMHEEPQIPNFLPYAGYIARTPRLRPGMTLAIEPMVNMGGPKVTMAADGWTVLTQDGKPCAHFEHTILVTDAEPEILTLDTGH
jgi:methionyl aminopeptidase